MNYKIKMPLMSLDKFRKPSDENNKALVRSLENYIYARVRLYKQLLLGQKHN